MVDLRAEIAAGAPQLAFTFGPARWQFVRIEPGRFLMGSPPGEPGRGPGETAPFEAEIGRAFYLARTPVTQAQYSAVTGGNPSRARGADLPVDQLTYVAATAFGAALGTLINADVRLPTEAQWEYACRAGTTTATYAGATIADLDRIAWYRDNAGGQSRPVAQKAPNPWGLYDMLGNVTEPCIDDIPVFDALPRRDPQGPRYADHGTMRGGGWMLGADRCRAAARGESNDMFGGMGVRPVIRV